MTENEAISMLEQGDKNANGTDFTYEEYLEAIEMGRKALEEKTMLNEIMHELSEYQAIGTVEEIQKKINSLKYDCSRYEEQLSIARDEKQVYTEDDLLLEKYRAIGTIEEFQALKEKNKPKKPIYSDFDDNGDDEIIPYKAICPICGNEFEFGSWNEEENHHCICGQKLDWQ